MKKPLLILPCRAGSERVPGKNIRPFGGGTESLTHRKLRQLAHSKKDFEILLTTNDQNVLEIASRVNLENLIIDERPEDLCRSDTPLSSLIKHCGRLAGDRLCLWTHVTSPFLELDDYREALRVYSRERQLGQADSLVAVHRMTDFAIFEGKPLNFDASSWPRSQDLEPVQIVTSGIFVMEGIWMKDTGRRLGEKPFFWDLDGRRAYDVDTPFEFEVASLLAEKDGLGSGDLIDFYL